MVPAPDFVNPKPLPPSVNPPVNWIVEKRLTTKVLFAVSVAEPLRVRLDPPFRTESPIWTLPPIVVALPMVILE